MSYKVVAFDLDGTLLNSERQISPESIIAIERLREQGVQIILVTGRHHVAVRAYHYQLQLDTPVICCNGTYLYDFKEDRVVHGAPLTQLQARRVLEIMNDDAINMLMYTTDAMNYQYLDDHLRELWTWANQLKPELRPVLREVQLNQLVDRGDVIWKFVACGEDPAHVQKMVSRLEQQMELSCEWSWHNRVDISAAGNTKGNRLSQLLNDWQISPEQVMAFGDNGNDVSLIQLAGFGVAMGNAVDELKQAADWVTLNNDDNGISHALNKFFPD